MMRPAPVRSRLRAFETSAVALAVGARVPKPQSEFKNRILSRLSECDFAALADHLEPVACPRHMAIAAPHRPIPHVYFLERGIASLIAVSPEDQRAEAGLIGREGFLVPAVVLGSDSITSHMTMQVAGDGHRVGRTTFLDIVHRSRSLQAILLRFVQTTIVQSTYTTLSNSVHHVDERLARWLLMCHDRSESDDIPLTHEFMAIMLAVRRPSVTGALHVLEGNGFIRNNRNCVLIRDRAGLETFAANAYSAPEAEYRRLIGPL